MLIVKVIKSSFDVPSYDQVKLNFSSPSNVILNSAASTTEKMSKIIIFKSRAHPNIFCIYFVVDFTSNFVQECLYGHLLQRYRVPSVYIGPSYRWCCGNDEKKKPWM